MKTDRTKIIVLLVFVVTLGAGVVAGLLAAKLPVATGTPVAPIGGKDSPLRDELKLTPEQSEKMQKIWEGVRDLSEQSITQSRQAEQLRDREIAKLIPAEKVPQYNEILRNYSETNAKLKGRREAAFEKAVAESNGILNSDQQKKYAEILAKRLGTEQAAGHDPMNVPAESGAASQPSL